MHKLNVIYCGWGEHWPLGTLADTGQQIVFEYTQQAIERGGSSLRDFASADGQLGHFQTVTKVYGRAGAPCGVCATPIVVIQQGQRSSFYCPRCQRP